MSLLTASSSESRARALGRAAESGDAALVEELLAAGAPADARLEGGATALMRASARGYADVARVLLDAGADANARRADGFSPLLLAVFFGHEEVVRLLLERGAHAPPPTRLGVTAIGWAESRGFKAISELLKNAPEAPAPEAESAPPPEPVSDLARLFNTPPAVSHAEAREAKAGARPVDAPPRERRADEPPPFRPKAYGPKFYTPARGFLVSWQAAVGAVLLAVAVGVAAFAIWQNKRGAGGHAPTPAPHAAQPPAPTPDLAAQPTPTPDAQGLAPPPEMPGAVIMQPYPYDQPGLVPPGAGVSTSAPSLVSESEPTAPEPASRRDPRDSRSGGLAEDVPAGRRDEARRADASRDDDPTRRDRSTDSELLSPPPTPPAPTPTPRSRVIQWPP